VIRTSNGAGEEAGGKRRRKKREGVRIVTAALIAYMGIVQTKKIDKNYSFPNMKYT
jgi:hypothetical protein